MFNRQIKCRKYLLILRPIVFALMLLMLTAPVFAGRHVVSSLPQSFSQSNHTADTWDTVVINGTKLTSATSGLEFVGCHNWLVQLDQDTIVFGQGSSSAQWGSYGINFRAYGYDGCSDVIIQGGYILNNPQGIDTLNYDPTDTLSGRCNGIIMGFASHNLTIDGTFIRIAAYSSHGIRTGGYHSQLIKNVTIDQATPGFHNRGSFDACAIKGVDFNTSELGGGIDYHFRIENVKVLRCPHAGFYFNANQTGDNYVVGQIEACSLVVDSRNIMYWPTGDGQTEHGRANCYGIQFTRAGPGTYIKNCKITAGESHHGGRGIQFVYSKATEANPVVVCSTYVESHESADVAFTGTNGYFPCAMKIRQNCSGIHVFDNTFIYIGDGSVPWGTVTGSYYRAGHPFVYQHWTSNPTPPYYITVENNLIRAIDRNPSGGADLDGVIFDLTTTYDPSFIWRHNRVETDDIGYRWGGYDGQANSTVIVGDTLRLVDTSNTDHCAFQLGYLSMPYDSRDVVMQDMYYENSNGNPTDYDKSIEFPSPYGNGDITLKRTLNIYVRGSNGLPVIGAAVTAVNNYGQTVINGTTDNGGRVSGVVSYYFDIRSGTDSATYNSFTINASRSGDNSAHDFNVAWDQYKDTLTLSSTVGDGVWDDDEPAEDVVAPSAINDLDASIGDSTGSVTLAWSVPGDDGDIGQAAYYIIKYATFAITDNNWSAATTVADPPLPTDPDIQATQGHTIYGIDPGVYYYFAMKTYDEANNPSPLSNIAESYAKGIAPPVTDSVSLDTATVEIFLFVNQVQSYLNLVYQYELDLDEHFESPVIKEGSLGGSQVYATYDNIQDNQRYYWRCRALSDNGSDTSAWSLTDNFIFTEMSIEHEDTTDAVFSPIAPLANAQLTTSYPTLIISNLDDNPNIYRFEISDDSTFSGPLMAASDDVDQDSSGQTLWKVDQPLEAGNYFWRAKVNGGSYSEISSFSIMPQTHVYPNPFVLSNGIPATFTEVPAGVNLTLTTVSGTIVKRWLNSDGSDISWNGTNDSGQQVASGVYLWYIEGTGTDGKLVVIK